MIEYNARFEIDVGEAIVFLDTLKKIKGVTIGSLSSTRFIPIAFCADNIETICPMENESGDYDPEDLLELAEYCARCNGEV